MMFIPVHLSRSQVCLRSRGWLTKPCAQCSARPGALRTGQMARLAGILGRCPWIAFLSVTYALMCALFLSLLASRLVPTLTVWRGIGQPEAFCAGTTAAYRKGNGTNSALTPLITPAPIGQSCTFAQPAPDLARRLRHVPWLRHLRRQQLGQPLDRSRGA